MKKLSKHTVPELLAKQALNQTHIARLQEDYKLCPPEGKDGYMVVMQNLIDRKYEIRIEISKRNNVGVVRFSFL